MISIKLKYEISRGHMYYQPTSLRGISRGRKVIYLSKSYTSAAEVTCIHRARVRHLSKISMCGVMVQQLETAFLLPNSLLQNSHRKRLIWQVGRVVVQRRHCNVASSDECRRIRNMRVASTACTHPAACSSRVCTCSSGYVTCNAVLGHMHLL